MDLVSQCALRVANVVWRPGHGGFVYTVVCKATFELQPELSPLSAVQDPVSVADWYLGEAGALAVASDLVPVKKRPEVLVTGHAYAPEGQPVSSVLARLVVGEIDKTIQVVGDRHFGRDGALSEPEHFLRMPLGWERAAVGPDGSNPAGRSLDASAQADLLGRVSAPNLLSVGLWLVQRGDVVPAVGFGPIAPLWPSRVACLGQHASGWDAGRWHERPLPADIDLGYFNAAPPDQQRARPFGEEAILLENLHPRFARLSTRLALVAPTATVDHASGPRLLQLRCDTLTIDTDRGIATLVWRAHVPLESVDRPGRVVVTGPVAPPASATGVFDATATLLPSALVSSAAVLPFSPAAAAVAPQSPALARVDTIRAPIDEDDDDAIGGTMGPGFTVPAAVLPFLAAQREVAARRAAPSMGNASDLPFVRPPADEGGEVDGPVTPRRLDPPEIAVSWAASSPDTQPRPAFAPSPSPVVNTPAPPPMIGPIAIISEETKAAPGSDALVVVEATEIEVESASEGEIDFDAYPPSRCGGVAARLACAEGEEGKSGEILRAEDLDAARWSRVHDHWLDRIGVEAARSRKTLLSEYDGGYVAALEAERGAIELAEYARLAEAAERGEAAGALAECGLPEGAWARIHRVWIGRMVGDVRLGKEVRGAIEAQRAVG